MHAASVKPAAATFVKAASTSKSTTAPPTSERVIRDEAGAD